MDNLDRRNHNIDNGSEAKTASQKEHKQMGPKGRVTLSPEVLEKYEILEAIGQGTYGVVFKAQERLSGQTVAIKVIDFYCSPNRARLAFRELYLMRALTELMGDKSVPIVRLLDAHFEEEAGQLYLIMEYMELDLGCLLDNASEVSLSEESVKKILYQTSCALAFLHEAGVMHRDIKPANILVDLDFNVKICDFGLARTIVEKQEDISELSRREVQANLKRRRDERRRPQRRLTQHICTRRYRAPEVLLLEKDYNTAADIWSLGCVLYELTSSSDRYEQKQGARAKPLFGAAKFCYPLSPMPEKYSKSAEHQNADLLQTILGVLGKQDSADYCFILDKGVAAYAQSQNSELSRVGFTKELPNTERRLAKVIGKTLKFNPYMRYSAKRIVGCSIFDGIRQPCLEAKPQHSVRVPEVDWEGAFSYENYKSFLTTAEISSLIMSETMTLKLNAKQ